MRKKKKKIIKRYLVLLALLPVVFLLGFLVAGGTEALRPDTFERLQELTAALPHHKDSPGADDPASDRANEKAEQDSLAAAAAEAARLAQEKLPDAEATKEKARRLRESAAEVADGIIPRTKRLLFLREAVQQASQGDSLVPYENISPLLVAAIVSVEDSHFFTHHGFDPVAIARAALVNLKEGEIEEGASTITQQLVKNLFLTQDRTMVRKLDELALAMDLELHFSKEEILTLYLNSIYFGSGFYGIEEAAQGYFNKKPSELTLAEAAMLAGLPNAPSLYSPYEDFLLAKKRQFIVLDSMVRTGAISKKEATSAKIEPIYLAR